MQALHLESFDGPGALRLVEVPEPGAEHPLVPGASTLIEVRAAGVSFADLLQTRGQYQIRPELPFVPGYEVAGTVRRSTAGYREGDRVAACTVIGAFAEVAVAPADLTYPLSKELSFAEGAGLIVNYHTAYFALRHRGRLRRGDALLIRGAAGGLGTALIEIGHALGAKVIAVVSSDEKERFVRELGAAHVLRAQEPWHEQARKLTAGRGVDVAIDPVGGARFTDTLRALARGGRAVVVGFTEGSIPEVRVNRLLLNNIEVIGAAWAEYVLKDPTLAKRLGNAVDRLVGERLIRPRISTRLPLERGADALRLLESRTAVGKIILEIA